MTKKRVNGKQKGNSFERDCCKILEENIGGSWTRSHGSGSYVGASNFHRASNLSANQLKSYLGDLFVPDDVEMIVECKSYKEIDFNNIIKGSSSKLNEWIEQNEYDVKTSGIEGIIHIIIFKINRKGSFVCVPALDVFNKRISYMNYYTKKNQYQIYGLKEFFDNYSEIFKKVISK